MMTRYEIDVLKEIRLEIRRVNRAAGRTIFNPMATSSLEDVLEKNGISTKMDDTENIIFMKGNQK